MEKYELTEKILEVPYVKQKTSYCGPACLEMALRFHGIETTQDEIAEKIGAVPYWGYTVGEIAQSARDFGLEAEIRGNTTIRELQEEIDQNRPAIILQKRELSLPEPHFRLTIGYFSYGPENPTIIIHDPDEHKGMCMPKTFFEHMWNIQGKTISILLNKL